MISIYKNNNISQQNKYKIRCRQGVLKILFKSLTSYVTVLRSLKILSLDLTFFRYTFSCNDTPGPLFLSSFTTLSLSLSLFPFTAYLWTFSSLFLYNEHLLKQPTLKKCTVDLYFFIFGKKKLFLCFIYSTLASIHCIIYKYMNT